MGTPFELFDHPVNRFVANFVGSANVWPRDAGDVAFRPHAVRLQLGTGDPGPDGLALAGAVESIEFLGEFVRYEVRVGERQVIADVPHARGVAPLARGTSVILRIPESELRRI